MLHCRRRAKRRSLAPRRGGLREPSEVRLRWRDSGACGIDFSPKSFQARLAATLSKGPITRSGRMLEVGRLKKEAVSRRGKAIGNAKNQHDDPCEDGRLRLSNNPPVACLGRARVSNRWLFLLTHPVVFRRNIGENTRWPTKFRAAQNFPSRAKSLITKVCGRPRSLRRQLDAKHRTKSRVAPVGGAVESSVRSEQDTSRVQVRSLLVKVPNR